MFVTVINDYTNIDDIKSYVIKTANTYEALNMLEGKLKNIKSPLIKTENNIIKTIKIYKSIESINKGWIYNSNIITEQLLFTLESVQVQSLPFNKEINSNAQELANDFIKELKSKVDLRNKRMQFD